MTGLSAMVLLRAAYFAENAAAVLLDPKRVSTVTTAGAMISAC